MLVLLWLSLLVVIAVIALWYYNYWKFERYLKSFPGPKCMPLVGNALVFKSFWSFLPDLANLRKLYVGNFKIYIGTTPYVFLSEIKELQFLLNSTTTLTKALPYRFTHKWLGQGLLTSTGEKWKKHRKIITPTFHFKILEDFMDVFNSAAQILADKFASEVGKSSTDVFPYLSLCTLDIICETAMGTSINAQGNSQSEYVKSVTTILNIILERAFSPLKQFDFIYSFTEMYQREKAALKVLHGFTDSVVRKKKVEYLRKKDDAERNVDDFGIKKRKAFLDLLIENTLDEGIFTDQDLRDEVSTFMFEGHDTVGTSMSFTLYSLATHPEVQVKAFKELKGIFADDPIRPVVWADLQKMQYLELVLKESLRMYPSVPFYGRMLTEDVVYEGRIWPKGTQFNIFIFGMQYDPVYYPKPNQFDPERFAPENMKDKSPYAYLPFSAGPRNCVGQKFAMAEMKTVVSTILRRYELLPVPGHELDLFLSSTTRSRTGVMVRLKKRVWDEE